MKLKSVAVIGDIEVKRDKTFTYVTVDGNPALILQRKSQHGLARLVAALSASLK